MDALGNFLRFLAKPETPTFWVADEDAQYVLISLSEAFYSQTRMVSFASPSQPPRHRRRPAHPPPATHRSRPLPRLSLSLSLAASVTSVTPPSPSSPAVTTVVPAVASSAVGARPSHDSLASLAPRVPVTFAKLEIEIEIEIPP